MGKIIDSFIFHNELDMLNLRLHELNDVVDYFVLAEATTTFTGEPKNLYFLDNKSKFAKFNDKIIHLVVNIPSELDVWQKQFFQRNYLINGLEDFSDNDMIIMSDVDEIMNPNTLFEAAQRDREKVRVFEQMMFYGNFNNYRHQWRGSITAPLSVFQESGMQWYRTRRKKIDMRIFKGGWHLSYFGNAEFISNKIQHLSNQSLNVPEFTNLDRIKYCVENKIDFFDRSGRTGVKRYDLDDRPKYKDLLKEGIYK